ncbi:hypothetical protein LJC07_00370 [Christensenellaceae bacterium OttesenSCG-928-L17]|nr:hypothetical protein [Christensenellaceae bacterium OttesenSCG-928-L17]
MNVRRNIKVMLVAFCTLFVVLSVYLVYTVNAYGTRWFSSPYNTRLNAQKNNVVAGDILDRNGKQLATTNKHGDRTYIDSRTTRYATAHVVGDNYGQTFGAENFFSKYLLGFDQSLFERVGNAFSGEENHGKNVVLSIDAELCVAAYNAMGDHQGAVVLMNYQTGELLASVSKPTFDPKYMAEYLNGTREMAGSAMVNRVNTGQYTPGSVFKVVTAAAALRYLPGITERTFTCNGPLAFDLESGAYLPQVHISPEEDAENRKTSPAGMSGEYRVLRDYNGDYHGELDFETAFSKSCNHVFAQLAMEVGAERLSRVAKELGLGDDFLFGDIVASSGKFEKAATDMDLAWSGVGQYTDQMTPIHMCMIAAGIANGGVMVEPKVLLDVVNARGVSNYLYSTETYRSALSKADAARLADYMETVVSSGTGRNAKVSGVTVAGKTGTAEVSSGGIRPNAWFVGFVRESEHPLAVCVVLEQGGSGGSNAAPVAQTVLKKAIALGY